MFPVPGPVLGGLGARITVLLSNPMNTFPRQDWPAAAGAELTGQQQWQVWLALQQLTQDNL